MAVTYEAIVRAQTEYARCIDDGDMRRWPDFFLDDCLYKITSADNYRRGLSAGVVYADSRGMLEDRVSALFEANIYERHSYRHLLGQPWLSGELGEETLSETPFIVVRIMRDGSSDVFASGRYVDRYRMHEGVALLAERVVVCDSKAIDTLLALPL